MEWNSGMENGMNGECMLLQLVISWWPPCMLLQLVISWWPPCMLLQLVISWIIAEDGSRNPNFLTVTSQDKEACQ